MYTYGENQYVRELPEGFVPRHQWPEYAYELDPPHFFNPKVIGTNPRGMRRGPWPLILEEYVSDSEPDLSAIVPGPNRLILWRRLTRTHVPSGWKALSKKPSALEGFADLTDSEDYASTWSKIARYERRLWHNVTSAKYNLERISLEEYKQTYQSSLVGKKIGLGSLLLMERKWGHDPNHILFFGARDRVSRKVVAGMGVINSPTYQASYYASGCMLSVPHTEPVMMGLIDHWFATSRANNIRFLHYGEFWIPGKPLSWKGFSAFKAKFHPHLVSYQSSLIRLKRGTLF